MSDFGPLPQIPPQLLTGSAQKLDQQIRSAQASSGEKKNDEIKKAAQEFEALFIAQLLKVMRETIDESGLSGEGFGKTIYTELFDQEVSLAIARQGKFGIGQMLAKSLLGDEPDSDVNRQDMQLPANKPVLMPATPSPATPQGEGATRKLESEIQDMQLPISAPVSSGFGLREDPISKNIEFHKGLDFSAPEGTRIVAALPGVVVSAKYESGYGNTVLVQHSKDLQTRYSHLSSINVKAGDVVGSRDILGLVGDTGRSTGAHLHFEVIRNGVPVDPRMAVGHNTSRGKIDTAKS